MQNCVLIFSHFKKVTSHHNIWYHVLVTICYLIFAIDQDRVFVWWIFLQFFAFFFLFLFVEEKLQKHEDVCYCTSFFWLILDYMYFSQIILIYERRVNEVYEEWVNMLLLVLWISYTEHFNMWVLSDSLICLPVFFCEHTKFLIQWICKVLSGRELVIFCLLVKFVQLSCKTP